MPADADTDTDADTTMSLADMPDCLVVPEFVSPDSVSPSLLEADRCIALERVCAGASVLCMVEPCTSPEAPAPGNIGNSD